MAIRIDLGQDVFHSPCSNLNLILRASVEMLLPPGDLNSANTNDVVQMVNSGELWLTQLPEIKMRILATTGSDLQCPISTLFTKFGEILCNSKLWSDLGIVILFKSCDCIPGPNGSAAFQSSFGLRNGIRRSTRTKTSRLPAVMQSFHDAIPPTDIPTAYLSTINVSLEYNHYNRSIQQYIPCYPVPISSQETLQDNILITRIEEYEPANTIVEPVFLPNRPVTQLQNVAIFEKSDISTFIEELGDADEEWQYSYKLPEEKAEIQWSDYSDRVPRELNTLLQTSFRALVAGNPREYGRETKVTKDECLTCLSRIIPSVFNFGYRDAMNQRSQLIPLIAKSIASILKVSHNPSLWSKTITLKMLHPQPESSPPSPATTDVRTVIRSSFWRIAQKQLYDPRASQKLSQLESMSSLDDEYSILDDGLPSTTPPVELDNVYNSFDSESYEENCYIGSDEDYLELWEEEETHSLLSLGEDHSGISVGMLEHHDTEVYQIGSKQRVMNSFETKTNISTLDRSDHTLCQLSLNDSEMLASDYLVDDLADPSPSSNTSIPVYDFTDEDYDVDYMLCDQL